MAQRAVRALSNIRSSASSARVLDLVSVAKNHGDDPQYKAKPLFRNVLLNRSIILKHRLRADEMQLFYPRRFIATKIIIPIDRADLRYGGRYVFVGQQHYDSLMRDCFGEDVGEGAPDRIVLDALDELPGLDPFILREHLSRRGIRAAACYFDVSEADLARMFEFVRNDIAPLVSLCFGSSTEFSAQTKKLVGKLLSNDLDNDLEPLRETLRLDKHQYSEGVFCWKGFLYYKWLVTSIFPAAVAAAKEISAARPVGRMDADEKEQIREGKERIGREIVRICNEIRAALDVYDRAFATLTGAGNPTAFRDFLLSSPEMFFDLGAKFAAIQHMVSFWRYRMPPGERVVLDPAEMLDMLVDFEAGFPQGPVSPPVQIAPPPENPPAPADDADEAEPAESAVIV
jgi:hypothetical protein